MTQDDVTASVIKPDADPAVVGAPGVMDEINAQVDKTVRTMADYVYDFIAVRFPEGLPPQMLGIITDIVIDAFHDGARWAEAQEKEESRIILNG